MEKKQVKLCKMIDGISWWLYNGKDRGVPEKCFLLVFQIRSRIYRELAIGKFLLHTLV